MCWLGKSSVLLLKRFSRAKSWAQTSFFWWVTYATYLVYEVILLSQTSHFLFTIQTSISCSYLQVTYLQYIIENNKLVPVPILCVTKTFPHFYHHIICYVTRFICEQLIENDFALVTSSLTNSENHQIWCI